MWLRIVLFLSLCLFCNGRKDFSCNFLYGFCGWYGTWNTNCHWNIDHHTFPNKKGFIYVNGAHNCHASLIWKFGFLDGYLPNYLIMDYYVTGPGPFSLSVSNNVQSYKVDWGCEIQPGNVRRQARVLIRGTASSIYINARVARGSKLIITKLRYNPRGHKPEKKCPLLPTTPPPITTTTVPTTTKIPTTLTTFPKTTTLTTTMLTTVLLRTTTAVPTTTNIIPSKTTSAPQDHKTITTDSPKEKPRNHTTSEIVTPSSLQNTRPFISTSPPIQTTNSATSQTENTTEKSRTQTINQTFSTMSYQTKLSSNFVNSTKIPNSQSTSNLVTKMSTGSSTVSAMFGAEKRKEKRIVIIAGSAGGLAVFIVLILLVTFFIKRRGTQSEGYAVSLGFSTFTNQQRDDTF